MPYLFVGFVKWVASGWVKQSYVGPSCTLHSHSLTEKTEHLADGWWKLHQVRVCSRQDKSRLTCRRKKGYHVQQGQESLSLVRQISRFKGELHLSLLFGFGSSFVLSSSTNLLLQWLAPSAFVCCYFQPVSPLGLDFKPVARAMRFCRSLGKCKNSWKGKRGSQNPERYLHRCCVEPNFW